jgi:DNA-binding transcriptional ArsR family regulator
MATTINKKINHVYILLERLAQGEELYAQNEELLEQLDVSERTLDRYLKDIYELYDKIVLTEKKKKEFTERKVTIYRVADRHKDVSKILKFFIENSNDLGWVLQMIHENDPSFLKELDESDRYDIEQNIKEDEGIFVFKSTPFESLEDPAHQRIFLWVFRPYDP